MTMLRFTGHIAGLGTTSGVRIVVGAWDHSPFGRFADVMVEDSDGVRTLLAPSDEVADFVAATYRFDDVRVVDVEVATAATWTVRGGDLEVSFAPGTRHPLGVLLRGIPTRLAGTETIARIGDPVARRVMPGVRTHGTAGNGRTEWYAARDVHRIRSASARWGADDLGTLAPVDPPVRFGFGSAPRTPCLTALTSSIRLPAART